MSAAELLLKMFRYQAWANVELLDAMNGLSAEHHPAELHLASRLMNHCLVVNRIFAAHLTGESHHFASDNTPDTPALTELRAGLTATDHWYLDYVGTVTPAMLSESVPFAFTDGDNGYMTREEMLTHVVTHGGYHRGEVGRILVQVSNGSEQGIKLPWDTYAVHLHTTEPSRRLRGREPLPEAVHIRQ
ncbi:DinB family protein [Paraburkholderia nemoris]|uniref:DinB family protein n=1 Tax=Paraburkholderia nemoris TaxID=2793076 RepID=UPI0038BD4DE2